MDYVKDRGRYRQVRNFPTIGQSISLWHHTIHWFLVWLYKIYLFSPARVYSTDLRDKWWLHDRLRAHCRSILQNRSFTGPELTSCDYSAFPSRRSIPSVSSLASISKTSETRYQDIGQPREPIPQLWSSRLLRSRKHLVEIVRVQFCSTAIWIFCSPSWICGMNSPLESWEHGNQSCCDTESEDIDAHFYSWIFRKSQGCHCESKSSVSRIDIRRRPQCYRTWGMYSFFFFFLSVFEIALQKEETSPPVYCHNHHG